MKPDVGHALFTSIQTLTTETAPYFEGDYHGGTVSSIAVLMALLGEEYDRAADVRLKSNNEIRELFAKTCIHLTDHELTPQLRSCSEQAEDSLRISELDRNGTVLKNLLIELHELIETLSENWAADINRDIWALLGRDARRALFDAD